MLLKKNKKNKKILLYAFLFLSGKKNTKILLYVLFFCQVYIFMAKWENFLGIFNK